MSKFSEIKELVANMEADAYKFFNNRNSAAGTRTRANAQTLKKLAQELRTDVTNLKNAGK